MEKKKNEETKALKEGIKKGKKKKGKTEPKKKRNRLRNRRGKDDNESNQNLCHTENGWRWHQWKHNDERDKGDNYEYLSV